MICGRCKHVVGEHDALVLVCTHCIGESAHRIATLEARVRNLEGEVDGLRAERETLMERLAVAEVQQ